MQENGSISMLNTSVLVLNRFYMAVHVISARRAFVLLYREIAEVVHFEENQYANYDFSSWCAMSELRRVERDPSDDWIRTVSFELQVPRVIRLYRYDRVPKQSLRFNRRNLFARDEHRCQYCGHPQSSSQLSFDHVVPRSRGGETNWENVVAACVDCNTRKGGRTPKEARMKLIRKPAKPNYSPLLASKLKNPKFESWRSFVGGGSAVEDVV